MRTKEQEYKYQWALKNKEKVDQRAKEHYQKNKEKKIAYQKEWREKNREKHREYSREWNKNNPEKASQRLKDWYKKNQGMRSFYSASRKAQVLKATPEWLSDKEVLHIQCVYQLCSMRNRESDIKWHVDHVVPLRGKTVCGLHVPWNLRVIPASDNMTKGNKFNG
jgi:hypothetical protein